MSCVSVCCLRDAINDKNNKKNLVILQSSVAASVQLLQQTRHRRMRTACAAWNDSWTEHHQTNLVVSHDLRTVFCIVNEAASTSWLRVLLRLSGNPAAQFVAATDRTSVHGMFQLYLEPVTTPLTGDPLKNYFKFLFVRDPLDRLVSAFRDKMFRSYKYVRLRTDIIRRFRHQQSYRYVQRTDSRSNLKVDLSDFVKRF